MRRKKSTKTSTTNNKQQKSSIVTRSNAYFFALYVLYSPSTTTSTTTSNKWHMREQRTKKKSRTEKPLCGIVNRVRIISTITNTTYTWNTIFINVLPLYVCCRNFSFCVVVVECCGHDERKYKVRKNKLPHTRR